MPYREVIFADPHLSLKDKGLDRFAALGRYIGANNVDGVTCLGDVCNFDCVDYKHNDRGSKHSVEAPSLDEERELIEGAFKALEDQQEWAKPIKRRLILGNHEDRIDRYKEKHPEFGTEFPSSVGFFQNALFGYDWKIYPYRSYVQIAPKVLVCHAVMNGANKPIEGAFAGRQAAATFDGLVIFGHIHSFSITPMKTINGKQPKAAISCPAFMKPNSNPKFMDGASHSWMTGFLELTWYNKKSWPSIKMISIEELMENYG